MTSISSIPLPPEMALDPCSGEDVDGMDVMDEMDGWTDGREYRRTYAPSHYE